jgi:hypothetical protein
MRHPNTHPLNVSYLVVGVVFLGIAGVWALRSAGVVGTDELHWLFPLTLVAGGAVGLAAFVVKGLRNDRRAPAEESADDTYAVQDAPELPELPELQDVEDVQDTTRLEGVHRTDPADTRGDLR